MLHLISVAFCPVAFCQWSKRNSVVIRTRTETYLITATPVTDVTNTDSHSALSLIFSVLPHLFSVPDYLRNPTLSIDVFKRYLKTFLFAQY